ncbi:hypothetical protein K2173_020424 [Erythroxylum novogranatense]|uniref:Myb-like domain-containing protein n=1 Tax=Erythroxylum novogranatense TaxID=1862640 RepID=A0AAV8TI56_9ROSI|nr:hypothetical protein K2173_020424 [Erythroxylum novogranatense]
MSSIWFKEMQEMEPNTDMQITQTPTKNETLRRDVIQDDGNRPSGRRTRSQVAPEWTTKEAMVLVNEIATVERDCLKVLSSYQKWKIVVGNCTAMEVRRTLHQCRRKWNSLLAEYSQISQWELSKSKTYSFWGLETESRREFGLPEGFDLELFRAMDEYVKGKKDHGDTDPDTDPEAEADFLDVISKLGSKRHKRESAPSEIHKEEIQECFKTGEPLSIDTEEETQGIDLEVVPQSLSVNEKVLAINAGEEPQESRVEQGPEKCCGKESSQKVDKEESSQKRLMEEKPRSTETPKRQIRSAEEKEQLVVEKLRHNAELIHAIVNGNLPETLNFGAADQSNTEDFHTKLVRRQGDKLITCLREIVNIIKQYPHLVKDATRE